MRAFIFVRDLRGFIFLRALRAFTFLRTFALIFLRTLHAYNFLPALRAFTFSKVSNFWGALCAFTFLYKMWSNPKSTVKIWNKQEWSRINRK